MTRKTIAFFPEASFGAALNCVGIAQALRERGHEAVFLCDPGFAGVFENYGFAEHPVPMAPDMSDEELEKFWSGFITRHLPHFRLSPEDQLPTYVRDCWEAIVDSAEIAEAPLQAALGRIDPVLGLWGPFAVLVGLILWWFWQIAYMPGGQPIGALENAFAKILKRIGRILRPRRRADAYRAEQAS